jgi:eukaryotic-like serine/threonine-protein kinase
MLSGVGVMLAALAVWSSQAQPSPVSLDASRAKQAYARALELESRADYSAALALLWEAAGLAPGDADIQYRLGEALERLGALDAAADAYRRASEARPDFRKAINNYILALAKAGRGAEAVARAQALVAAAPGDPERLFTLGLAQSEQDVDAAIATFRRVLERAPRHTLARYNLALALRRVDRLSEALGELQPALTANPVPPQVSYLAGVIYLHQGALDRATDALRSAIAAEPGYFDAHYTLGAVLKAKRDWDGAAAALRRAVALNPGLPAAHYALGQVLQQSGDAAGARAQEVEGDRLRGQAQLEQEAGVWTAVGIARLDAGDASAARDAFARAIQAFDGYAAAHYQLGRALQRLGEREAAQAAFRHAQQLNPSLIPPPDRFE